eukprot:8162021-Pyramimonas_sp.AAC.1
MESVMKATGWMHNNRQLAEFLSRRCKGKHKHTQLMGRSKARGAKSYTTKLKKAILKAGPIPDQEIEYWMPDAPYDGVAENGFWDDVSEGRFESELVRGARKLEMDWMKR